MLPVSATGDGRIDQAVLTARITGTPVKTYDGNVSATLSAGDYALDGFVAGEGASVTRPSAPMRTATPATGR